MEKIVNNQEGKAISWALLIVGSLWGSIYLYQGHLISTNLDSALSIMVITTSVTISIFTLAYGIYFSFLQSFGKGDKKFAKKLSQSNRKLEEIIYRTENILAEIQEDVRQSQKHMSAKAVNRLEAAKAILENLKNKNQTINQNLKQGSNQGLLVADSLIRAKTVSCDYNKVVENGGFNNPDDSLKQIEATLNRLIEDIKSEDRKRF